MVVLGLWLVLFLFATPASPALHAGTYPNIPGTSRNIPVQGELKGTTEFPHTGDQRLLGAVAE